MYIFSVLLYLRAIYYAHATRIRATIYCTLYQQNLMSSQSAEYYAINIISIGLMVGGGNVYTMYVLAFLYFAFVRLFNPGFLTSLVTIMRHYTEIIPAYARALNTRMCLIIRAGISSIAFTHAYDRSIIRVVIAINNRPHSPLREPQRCYYPSNSRRRELGHREHRSLLILILALLRARHRVTNIKSPELIPNQPSKYRSYRRRSKFSIATSLSGHSKVQG